MAEKAISPENCRTIQISEKLAGLLQQEYDKLYPRGHRANEMWRLQKYLER